MSATEWKNVATPWWLRGLDYFFLMRPVLFVPGWITLIAGYFVATQQNRFMQQVMAGQWQFTWGNVPLIGALVAFSAAMGGSFIFNQIYDVESDRKNNKLFLLGNGIISIRAGITFGSLLLVGSLLVAWWLNPWFTAVILAFNIITAYMYNSWPFHLKSRPIGGLLANMAMGLLAFWAGWATAAPLDSRAVVFAIPYLLLNTGLYLFTTLPDVAGDQATQRITFPVRFGVHRTITGGLILIIGSGICAAVLQEEILQLVVLLLVPGIWQLVRQRSVPAAVTLLKQAILIFAVVVSVKIPWMLVVGLLLFGVSRFYYRVRFNLEYPTLKPR